MRGMGGMGGMGGLMAQAQKMQQKLAKVQEELKQTEFTGEAANGAVKVVITGGHDAQQTCRTESEAAMNKAVPLPAGMKLPF